MRCTQAIHFMSRDMKYCKFVVKRETLGELGTPQNIRMTQSTLSDAFLRYHFITHNGFGMRQITIILNNCSEAKFFDTLRNQINGCFRKSA